jgi:chloride channel protein, CIC family
LLLAVASATLVARTIERRSIYDARLTDEEVEERRRLRELATPPSQRRSSTSCRQWL